MNHPKNFLGALFLFTFSTPTMNVLVYSGPGTTTEGVKHCLETLRLHLGSYYAVLPVNETVLLNEPWMRKTSLLVIPGGADLPYCNVLDGNGTRRFPSMSNKVGSFRALCWWVFWIC